MKPTAPTVHNNAVPTEVPPDQTKPLHTPPSPVPTYMRLHREALAHPRTSFELAFVRMYDAWRMYAQAHRHAYDHRIGEDCVLGPEWESIGRALMGLLNGNVGSRIDSGTMWATIRDYMAVEGVDLSKET